MPAASSAEIVHSGVMETLVWLRVPGDIVFSLGAAALGLYALKLLFKPKRLEPELVGEVQPGVAD